MCSPVSAVQDPYGNLCDSATQLDTVQAEEGSYAIAVEADGTAVSAMNSPERYASPVLMETLPIQGTAESQPNVEPTQTGILSEEPKQAFSPCYHDNTHLSVISTGVLSQPTYADPAEIHVPTTRSRAKLASNIISPDLTQPQNKQLLPIDSPTKQLSTIASPTKQLIPIASPTKQLSTIASPTKQLSTIDSPTKQLLPIASPTKQLLPIASPTKQLLPIASPTKQLLPIASPTKQLSTIASPTKQLSTIASPTKQLLTIASPIKQLSPTYTVVITPRRSPRLTTTPDTNSPVQADVFHLPAARPLSASLPSQPISHIGMHTKPSTRGRQAVSATERQRTAALIPVRKSDTSLTAASSGVPGSAPAARTRSLRRKRISKIRKSKTQCLHSLERDRQSKPVHTSLSTKRRVIELPKLLPRGSRQLAKSPSSSKILSEYLRETCKHPAVATDKEFSQMRTKKVSNLLALSEYQQEPGGALSAGEEREEREVGVSGGESDVEMGMGPTKRVVGRGSQRRRIKSKVYISESEECCSDASPPPPDPDRAETEIRLVEETVAADCIVSDSISVSSVRDSTQLSRVTDTAVCLEPERMRTLFSIPVTRARSRLPVYSLDSLGFYDPTPALSEIIRIKQEFSPACSYEAPGLVPDCEFVDLTPGTERETEVPSSPIPSQSSEDLYVSPASSPAGSSSSFSTPCSSDLQRRPIRSASPLQSASTALSIDAPVSVSVNVRTTRSGNEYRSYLTTDFSNEESSLPFANFLSQTVPPADSPQQPDAASPSEPMDCSAPLSSEQTDTGHTDSATNQQVNTSNYWKKFLAESTTITELMSSSTLSSQSTSELFQAKKSKFQALSIKQKQRNHPRGKRCGKNFPAKRGYVVGQRADTQDADSDEEIDCMLQELRERKETRKKPERPKTATKKIVVIGKELFYSVLYKYQDG